MSTNKKFLSLDEIVQDLYQSMDNTDIQEFKQLPKSSLATLHFNLGLAIRNRYDLWDADNFPDQMSALIIERLHEKVNGR